MEPGAVGAGRPGAREAAAGDAERVHHGGAGECDHAAVGGRDERGGLGVGAVGWLGGAVLLDGGGGRLRWRRRRRGSGAFDDDGGAEIEAGELGELGCGGDELGVGEHELPREPLCGFLLVGRVGFVEVAGLERGLVGE